MKTKVKILGVLALALVVALAVSAGEDKWVKLKAELNLTDAQVTELQTKFKELDPLMQQGQALKAEITAMANSPSPDQKAIDAKKAELMAGKKKWMEKADAIYRSVLTPEQYAKLKALEEEAKKSASEKKQ